MYKTFHLEINPWSLWCFCSTLCGDKHRTEKSLYHLRHTQSFSHENNTSIKTIYWCGSRLIPFVLLKEDSQWRNLSFSPHETTKINQLNRIGSLHFFFKQIMVYSSLLTLMCCQFYWIIEMADMALQSVIFGYGWHPRWLTTWQLIKDYHKWFHSPKLEFQLILCFLSFPMSSSIWSRLDSISSYMRFNESPKWCL